MRRNTFDKNIRKITRSGDSYAITLPIDMVRELGWREKQKVVLVKRGKGIVIKDWFK
ncbi:MAG: AbrB/MazE/SpoVT family DNA-binding domain-containing protein [Nanoarchaeota archaeon]|nr:AbrB/MazE/SpoVT family DNA-binding domain-containing protein [Nanoarchaeota archaeon]